MLSIRSGGIGQLLRSCHADRRRIGDEVEAAEIILGRSGENDGGKCCAQDAREPYSPFAIKIRNRQPPNAAGAERIGDGAPDAAGADDECLPAVRAEAVCPGRIQETQPVDIVSGQPAVRHAPDHVDGQQTPGAASEFVQMFDHRALVRDCHHAAVRIVPAPQQRQEEGKLPGRNVGGDHRLVEAKVFKTAIEQSGRADLGDRVPDDERHACRALNQHDPPPRLA